MKKLYDLTLPVSASLPVWPGDPPFQIESLSSTAAGDEFNVSAVHLGTHTGTHVDAPRHMGLDLPGVDQLPPDILLGDAWACRFPPTVRALTAESLEVATIPATASRLLLATSNSAQWDAPAPEFNFDFVALTPDGADWLVSHGIRLVGIDYLSIGPDGPDGLYVHRRLLDSGIVVIEGLDLRRLPEGWCRLYCLPLKLEAADGAPARVFAER